MSRNWQGLCWALTALVVGNILVATGGPGYTLLGHKVTQSASFLIVNTFSVIAVYLFVRKIRQGD